MKVLCLFVNRFSPFSYQNSRRPTKMSGRKPRVFTLAESAWFCVMSLTPQGKLPCVIVTFLFQFYLFEGIINLSKIIASVYFFKEVFFVKENIKNCMIIG